MGVIFMKNFIKFLSNGPKWAKVKFFLAKIVWNPISMGVILMKKVWTNLGPIVSYIIFLDKPRSYVCQTFSVRPHCYKPRVFNLGLTIAI